jgi:type I restriction enzyme M protein
MGSNIVEKAQHDLKRFYTRTAVGELLVEQLGDIDPRKVLDLGAGEGSLSVAVVRRWTGAESVTVDLDPSVIDILHANILGAGANRHLHHIHDILDPALPIALEKHGAFDLAVCNPPFFRPTWSRDHAQIFQEANLADACPTIADATAEILFLAQNLRVLRDGGKVALIAPDGLLTGWRTMSFRRTVMEHHSVDCVMQLPNYSFHDTEARCFILILTKNAGPTRRVKLLRYDLEAGLSDPIYVGRDEAEQRMDFDFHSTHSRRSGGTTTLRRICAEVRRGSIDTTARKAATFPTFHTTDYREFSDGLIALADTSNHPAGRRLVIAEAGDILMARVDRSLHLKVGIVMSGSAPVTDCIYRVRVPPPHRVRAFDALRSPSGAASLLAVTKGVSARLLGKADLLDLPLQLLT